MISEAPLISITKRRVRIDGVHILMDKIREVTNALDNGDEYYSTDSNRPLIAAGLVQRGIGRNLFRLTPRGRQAALVLREKFSHEPFAQGSS